MNPKMNNFDPSQTSDEPDEYPKVTQADLDRATFRVGLKPAPRRRGKFTGGGEPATHFARIDE